MKTEAAIHYSTNVGPDMALCVLNGSKRHYQTRKDRNLVLTDKLECVTCPKCRAEMPYVRTHRDEETGRCVMMHEEWDGSFYHYVLVVKQVDGLKSETLSRETFVPNGQPNVPGKLAPHTVAATAAFKEAQLNYREECGETDTNDPSLATPKTARCGSALPVSKTGKTTDAEPDTLQDG